MKNKILFFGSLLAGCALFVAACNKTEDPDSIVVTVSQPFVYENNLEDVYIYGEGNTSIYTDIPDVVAIVVDTVYGFAGGYGGKTGMDTIKILKSDVLGFGDTVSVGGSSYSFEKYNKGNYRIVVSASVVIAGANNNPGPTALEGTYVRTANGYGMVVSKVSDGIYLITNPGGAATVADNPYLLYNFKKSNGTDSLSFAIQKDLCGGGLQLVSPAAPLSLTSADYTASHPPEILVSGSTVTFNWKVFEFPTVSASSANTGVALCNWGTGVRSFVRQ